ncbi:MAG TPA: D-alanyl-D-alanine carboxypeptidase/D-alanyl-D-alanine-endopeptidase [Ilumatobacteraceae bacterium]|nr:D-alanyl-D-alanine carboxypeptidase/D-alanyl-D-alanine-endopeptidase [Ilumatobacteraceae bacterium]
MRRRRRRGSLIVLLVLLVTTMAVPALGLAWLWQWAEVEAEPPPTTTTTLPEGYDDPAPELDTELLSMRRGGAEELAARARDDAYRAVLQPFFDAVPEGSCAAIDIDGVRFADVRAGLAVVPASNQKLLVAAVALEVLGEDHRFRTELRGPQPVDGVITGDVYLVGGGDPLLVTADYVDPSPLPAINTTSIEPIADALQAAGVTQIVGDVIGDGSRYDDEFAVPSWGPDFVLGAEAGPYDALMINDGRTFADSTIGFNPNQSAARQFIRVLQARNITVTGRSRNGTAPADGSVAVLAGVDSVPLSDVVDELLQTSDNNTAELLVKEIGFAVRGEGTRVAGLQEIWNTLAEWQVPLDGVALDDGSGLSRNDRLTCNAIVAILEHLGVDSELTRSLPVAGESGTLAAELIGGPGEGSLAAKTGTLTGVRALSGFLPTDDSVMTFSLVLNGAGVDEPGYYQPLWTRLVTLLDGYPIGPHADEFAPP